MCARHVRNAGSDKVEARRDGLESFRFVGCVLGLRSDNNSEPSDVHRLSSLGKHGLRISLCVDLVDSMWVQGWKAKRTCCYDQMRSVTLTMCDKSTCMLV